MTELKLEVRDQEDRTPNVGPVMLTPPIGEDYWAYRVRVADGQAIVAFPKFSTIGIGFAVEEDWNTNLPYDCGAEEIYDHIEHNRGDESITREACVAAIRMIQNAIETAEANARKEPARWKFACPEHLIGPAADFCTPCRATWTSAAAQWLRDLAEGGDVRDACGPKIPTTLAEAADELDALAAAIASGDVS